MKEDDHINKSQVSSKETEFISYETIKDLSIAPEDIIFHRKSMEIINKIPNNSYLIRILSSILICPPIHEASLEKLIKVISDANEKIAERDCLDDMLVIAFFFCKIIKEIYMELHEIKNKSQTVAANKKRKNSQLLFSDFKDLHPYLSLVEYKLHPPEDSDRKRSKINKDEALKRVFSVHKNEIMAILNAGHLKNNKTLDEAEAIKKFGAFFDAYTDQILEFFGQTETGYIPETRKPRSEDSKRKSSESAKASRAKQRATRRKESSSDN